MGTRSTRAGLLIVFSNNFNERYLINDEMNLSLQNEFDRSYRSINIVGRPL